MENNLSSLSLNSQVVENTFLTTSSDNILHILSKRETGIPSAHQQLKRWHSRLISKNIRENQCVQKTINLGEPLISYDRKDQYMVTLKGSSGLMRAVMQCTIDFWDLAKQKNLWSRQVQATEPERGRILLTEDLHVILPQIYEERHILILSADKVVSIKAPKIKIESTRVLGNQIAAFTKQAFFVWDTDGQIKWSQGFPDRLVPNKFTIACNEKYYVSQLGHWSKRGAMKEFHGSSLFFVANLDKRRVSCIDFYPVLTSQKAISTLAIHDHTLYIASCEPKNINFTEFGRDLQIRKVDLIKEKQLAIYTSTFLYGMTHAMIATSSQLFCINNNVANDPKNKENRIEILNSNLTKEKSITFRTDNFWRGHRNQVSCYSDEGYFNASEEPIELSSIPDESNFDSINVFSDFANGIFSSIDRGMHASSIIIKDYNRQADA